MVEQDGDGGGDVNLIITISLNFLNTGTEQKNQLEKISKLLMKKKTKLDDEKLRYKMEKCEK